MSRGPIGGEGAAARTPVRLNLGCGNKARAGFVGVDRFPCGAVQVLCDLEERLPFRDDSVDAVHLDNTLEHIGDLLQFVREISRICRHGAVVSVITPHFTSWDSWRDPTHRQHLSYFSMDHFAKSWIGQYGGCRLIVERRHLSFSGGLLGLIGRLVFSVSPRFWEKKLCFLFRGGTLYFDLKVAKTPSDAQMWGMHSA
jgi:SAM-dependent methyltransferase